MKCSQCGTANKGGAKFCIKCGAALGRILCPKCGNENQPESQFCQECGASLTSQEKINNQVGQIPVRTGLSSPMKIAIVVLGSLVLITGFFFLFTDIFSVSRSNAETKNSAGTQSNILKVAYVSNPATVIQEGTPFHLVYYWSAATREQVQDFVDNAVHTVLVNGETAAVNVKFGEIYEDSTAGKYKVEVATDVGQLPLGISLIENTITLKKLISDGLQSFGVGSENEKIEVSARVIMNSPTDPQASSVDHTPVLCPSSDEVYALELLQEGGEIGVAIINKLGWEPYQQDANNPPYFLKNGNPWIQPVCQLLPDDNTILACTGKTTDSEQTDDQIGLYLPYPWSKSRDAYCTFENQNLSIAEPVGECPTEDMIEPGEVYWEDGFATLEITNPDGWEPYQEWEESPPFLSLNNEEIYTSLVCEVDPDDNTLMTCKGPGDVKTSGIGLFLSYPFEGQFCSVSYLEISIK